MCVCVLCQVTYNKKTTANTSDNNNGDQINNTQQHVWNNTAIRTQIRWIKWIKARSICLQWSLVCRSLCLSISLCVYLCVCVCVCVYMFEGSDYFLCHDLFLGAKKLPHINVLPINTHTHTHTLSHKLTHTHPTSLPSTPQICTHTHTRTYTNTYTHSL